MWNIHISDDENKPYYLVIADALERDILSGELLPGARLMTYRELSAMAKVTVSTISKAYAEAKRRGLIKTHIGRGTFVQKNVLLKPSEQDIKANSIVEFGVAMPLFSEEPSIKPILQKIMQSDEVDALVKYFSPLGRLAHRETGASWLCHQMPGLNI
ncbi:GntR family transcriptional regulator [Oxalobacter vibrioformis]|uniref:GntR family transcriptional regulator n=2 Tax=Oxalobacter vibrioformis TaxID=933080 RepID=A0A9E9P552_9BURK|nr:GntR family transcriptional regulator [Oxalobacter vibrioformis]WAW10756.1 GntR family transcriptional regulator [Oxalobacter vibrioformis]